MPKPYAAPKRNAGHQDGRVPFGIAETLGLVAGVIGMLGLAGGLLTVGYFTAFDPALIQFFSWTELALIGFAHLAGGFAILSFLCFFVLIGAALLPTGATHRTAGKADLLLAGVSIAAAIYIAIIRDGLGLLGSLLALVAIALMVLIAATAVRRRETWLRARLHQLRWVMPPLLGALGLLALGEAGSAGPMATPITLAIGGKPRHGILIAAGSQAMIVKVGRDLYVAGARGEDPLPLCWMPLAPADQHRPAKDQQDAEQLGRADRRGLQPHKSEMVEHQCGGELAGDADGERGRQP